MKRSHSFLTLSALLSVGLGGLVYLLVRTATMDPATEHEAKRPVAGAATTKALELAELRGEMIRLNAQVRNQGQRLAVDPTRAEAHDPSTTPDPRADPEARAEQERKHREYMAGIDAAFRTEATDPQWSSATSSVVHTAITGDNDLRTLARDMECRSRTCRVEIADDGSGKLDKILPMFAQQVGQDLPSVTADHIENASGGTTIVLYMSRRDDTQAMTP